LTESVEEDLIQVLSFSSVVWFQELK
jgi:hypothetical protein